MNLKLIKVHGGGMSMIIFDYTDLGERKGYAFCDLYHYPFLYTDP